MASRLKMEASTEVASHKCTFTWTIKNYRLIKLEVGERIGAPKFGVGIDDKQYFQLLLYPAGYRANDDYLAIFLRPIIDSTNEPDKLVCRWTISAINDEKVVRKMDFHHDFASMRPIVGYGSRKLHKLENIDELISAKNTVTFQCELEIFDIYESSCYFESINGKDEKIDGINFDFSLSSDDLSDVTLIVEKKEIPAHKIILATASPVFRDMFIRDNFGKTSTVEITDIPYCLVMEMLRYMYTRKIEIIDVDTIHKLFIVAGKYQIDNLKIKCGKMLCTELSSANVIDILVSAHKYEVKNLKDEAIKFITNHTELLYNSEKMKKIDDPDLWINLTQSILKSQKELS